MMFLLLHAFIVLLVFHLFLAEQPIRDSLLTECILDEVEIQALNKTVYLKQANWGVSSDSKIIVLSSNPENQLIGTQRMIFSINQGPPFFIK